MGVIKGTAKMAGSGALVGASAALWGVNKAFYWIFNVLHYIVKFGKWPAVFIIMLFIMSYGEETGDDPLKMIPAGLAALGRLFKNNFLLGLLFIGLYFFLVLLVGLFDKKVIRLVRDFFDLNAETLKQHAKKGVETFKDGMVQSATGTDRTYNEQIAEDYRSSNQYVKR